MAIAGILSKPPVMIGLSRALQALATPLIAFLVTRASDLSGGMAHPVSFCNVLFVGNTCAAVVVLSVFGVDKIKADLTDLPKKTYLGLLVFGALSALLSALIYTALETIMVTNAVLLARLGPLLYAIMTALLLGQSLGRAEWAGFGFIILGVFATIFGTGGLELSRGDLLIIASSFVYAVVTLMSKQMLGSLKVPTVVFVRNAVSSVTFFSIANAWYGPHHFADAFAGQLWIIMLVYSAIVIVAAQYLWYRAIGTVDAATVAKWVVLSPIIAIFYAFVLNGERPSPAQYGALALVTVGVLITNLGKLLPKEMPAEPEASVAAS